MNRFEESIDRTAINNGMDGTGYLIVRVATARGAIPIENAHIRIRAAASPDDPLREEGASGEGALIAVLRTDRDGLAPRLALPAPSRALSERPGGTALPYALYDIEVTEEGYESHAYQNVPIFDTVTSLQTVELIPLSEGQREEDGITPPGGLFRILESNLVSEEEQG